jgi:hypothetical protein
LAGSDDQLAVIKTGLNQILHRKLVSAKIAKPAWDLSLEFSNGLRLNIFCERTARRSGSGRNWQMRIGAIGIYAGPGTELQISK